MSLSQCRASWDPVGAGVLHPGAVLGSRLYASEPGPAPVGLSPRPTGRGGAGKARTSQGAVGAVGGVIGD